MKVSYQSLRYPKPEKYMSGLREANCRGGFVAGVGGLGLLVDIDNGFGSVQVRSNIKQCCYCVFAS